MVKKLLILPIVFLFTISIIFAYWSVDNTIIAGLPSLGGVPSQTVFYKEDVGVWHLIAVTGPSSNGFHWNGTAWANNLSIVGGLQTPGSGTYPVPAAFYK